MMLLLLLACPPTKTDDTSTTDTTPFACDALSCAETDLCVRQDYPAECTNREDTGAACPEGTTATMCGGAGIPCCCEPAPACLSTALSLRVMPLKPSASCRYSVR